MALALKLALVVASVLIASLAARRFGHAVGGTIAGLPMIAGPIMGFVLLQQPAAQVQAIAHATLACLPASVLHQVCFGWCATRWRWPVALAAANAVFLVVGALLVLHPLPVGAAAALAVAATLLGPVVMPSLRLAPSAVAIARAELAWRAATAVVMAWAVMRSAALFPAAVSGLLLAIPITGNVLPCFTLPGHGAAATIALLAGFVRGLLAFAIFMAVLALWLPAQPGAAYAAAWAGAALVAVLRVGGWQHGRRRLSRPL